MASVLREQTRIKESLESALEKQKEGMFDYESKITTVIRFTESATNFKCRENETCDSSKESQTIKVIMNQAIISRH